MGKLRKGDSCCSDCNGGQLCPLRLTSEGQTEGLAPGECQGLTTGGSGHSWDFSIPFHLKVESELYFTNAHDSRLI
jgi:hypothetical protein